MNIIEKLNSIDVKDLQNIDLTEVKEHVLKKPIILMNISLIILTLFGIISIRTSVKQKLEKIEAQITSLEKKIVTIKETEVVNQEYQKYVLNFPKAIDRVQFIDKITEIARTNDIKIKSFSPGKNELKGIQNIDKLKLEIISENYQNLLGFVYDIENSPYALLIREFSANPQTLRRKVQNQNSALRAQLTIESVRLEIE